MHQAIRDRCLVLVAVALVVVTGCSGGKEGVPVPPNSASADEVAHALLSAYQAGDTSTLKLLSTPRDPLRPGDLGRLSQIRWSAAVFAHEQTPGFSGREIYVPFNATTTGSPDGSIFSGSGWPWGFVLARRSSSSRWLLVDEGTP
jgi:hypothetical protein